MEETPQEHQKLLDWAKVEYKDILENSNQAIYLYVCDKHRLANDKFISMLGYNSQKEWESKDEMMSDLKDEDQESIISAYQNAMENKSASSVNVSWINKKTKALTKTNVILIPLSYKGTLFALHFITNI